MERRDLYKALIISIGFYRNMKIKKVLIIGGASFIGQYALKPASF